MKRRRQPKRRTERLLRLGREAQAPAGWVPLGELALQLVEDVTDARGGEDDDAIEE